jgi:hypothetical protein
MHGMALAERVESTSVVCCSVVQMCICGCSYHVSGMALGIWDSFFQFNSGLEGSTRWQAEIPFPWQFQSSPWISCMHPHLILYLVIRASIQYGYDLLDVDLAS